MSKNELRSNRTEISRIESGEIIVVEFAKPQIPIEKPVKVEFPLMPNPFKVPERTPDPAPQPVPNRPVEEPVTTPKTPVPAHR